MIHGPCGLPNRRAPCMINGKCIRFFPKKFHEAKIVDQDGFPVYRRRNNGRMVWKHGIELDNRFVVPYSPQLLLKYRTHLNVKWCNQSTSIKYMFKYIYKGSYQITIDIVNVQNQNSRQNQVDDEIKHYLDCRYVSLICSLNAQHPSIHNTPSLLHLLIHILCLCFTNHSIGMSRPLKHVGRFLHSLCMDVHQQLNVFISTFKINGLFTGQIVNKLG